MNRRLKWTLAIAFLLVFAAGVMTGGFVGQQYRKHRRHIAFKHHPGPVAGRMQEHLRRELQLTAEQTATVWPIIESATGRLQAIHTETSTRVRETMEEAHRELAPHLTPEQQTKLTSLHEQHQHQLRMRRFRGRPPGGSHHGPPEP